MAAEAGPRLFGLYREISDFGFFSTDLNNLSPIFHGTDRTSEVNNPLLLVYLGHRHLTNNSSDESDRKFLIAGGGGGSQDIFCLNFSTQDY